MTKATHPFDALMDITARPSTVFVRGEGSFLWDESGKRYLDFVQGWAVNCLGHSPPVVAEALAAQAKLLLTPSPAFYNAPSLKLANALVDRSCFDRVFFTNSGAEANEGAIKLARKYGALHRNGAHEIITFAGAFHGRTLATMSASGKKAFEPLFEPKVPGFPKAQLNDLASVEGLINDKTIGVMIEPIQGEAGIFPIADEMLVAAREACDAAGAALVFDEVQTGMGRTGSLWAYEQLPVRPDVMTAGKALGGGLPVAACVTGEELGDVFEPGDHGSTFAGAPIAAAAALAALEVLDDSALLARVRARGARFMAGLGEIDAIAEVRGSGLMVGVTLVGERDAREVADRCLDAGLVINVPGHGMLRFLSPLVISAEEVEAGLAILDRALEGA
jgi:acetylornithine/N-succinyldiaminopimelate aminotransferase